MDTKKSKKLIRDVLLSIAAAIMAAVNIKTFINAGNIVPGGFSGVTLFLIRVVKSFTNYELSYSLIYILLNIPGVYLSFKYIGKRFTILGLIDVVLTSVLVEILPTFTLTEDLLLNAVFGGIIGGIGNSLVLIGNGCGGGTDFISIYFAKKKNKSTWTEMMFINIIIIVGTGISFGWDYALYSIIYQYVSTQVINILDDRYQRSCFTIITNKPDEISETVYNTFHHTVTKLEAVGGYTNEGRTMLYVVVGQYEAKQFGETILEIDPQAFINITKSSQVLGNFKGKTYE